jgi:DNA invertase Pin-like site-specific DNA recombinase
MARSKAASAKAVRCAIYTRKSHEEGLEQDFNSLDAQREACEAFILSQKHAGWRALPAMYDDGGVSGATLERPALQRLLDDVRARRLDVLVVYKVDRLTRSLADFAKIVETFDAHGVSFVSVTQQFNTTNSMGRLTLNVLLSFAQFEREVTGERIRDKIAASKKKGMWMGGLPPLGYDVRERKLVVHPEEAQTVRHIYARYGELGSVRLLQRELEAQATVSKVRTGRGGRRYGGKPFGRGALYLMLQNRIYLGEIVHKQQSYPGQHEAIIDRELWRRIQQRLEQNRVERKISRGVAAPSLLTGLLYDGQGHHMTPTHAVKNGRRYRYYVSRPLITQSRSDARDGWRVPAADLEQLVADRLCGFLSSEGEVYHAIEPHLTRDCPATRLIARAGDMAATWSDLSPADRRAVLGTVVARIEVHPERLDVQLSPSRLADLLTCDPSNLHALAQAVTDPDGRLSLPIQAQLKRVGLGMKMVVAGARSGAPDPSLIKLFVKAYELQGKFLQGNAASIAEFARREGMSESHITRHLRLAFVAPDIVKAILSGQHPPSLTAASLIKDTRLPLTWMAQRSALGFI